MTARRRRDPLFGPIRTLAARYEPLLPGFLTWITSAIVEDLSGDLPPDTAARLHAIHPAFGGTRAVLLQWSGGDYTLSLLGTQDAHGVNGALITELSRVIDRRGPDGRIVTCQVLGSYLFGVSNLTDDIADPVMDVYAAARDASTLARMPAGSGSS